jgi:predicted lactoylglutathione lyase
MTHIFVNIATSDLDRAKAFYTSLGAEINPLFTDENAACIVWDDNIQMMVLTKEYFATFTTKEVADTATTAQALIGFSRDSREHVDSTAEAAIASGGKEHRDPQDYGFMYSRSIEDLDGAILEFIWMDPAAVEQGPEAAFAEQQAQA